ncbi:MAG: hypothetical protein ACRDD2_09485 [Sarcina sp.]
MIYVKIKFIIKIIGNNNYKNINKGNKRMKVNLEDVMEAIEYENESVNHYYNKETGVIIYIEDSESSSYNADDIERIDEFEEWVTKLLQEI